MKSFIVTCLAVCAFGGAAQAAPLKLTPLPPLTGAPAATAAQNAVAASVPPAAPAPTSIYSGQGKPDQAGLRLSAWGAGSAKDSTAINLGGGHVISVTTVDPYQGAVLTFKTPYALGNLSDPTRFLQMTMQFPRAVIEQQYGGGNSGALGSLGAGSIFQEYGGGAGMSGDNGNDDSGAGNAPVNPNGPPVITYLRWVFTLADGQQAEVRRPLPDGVVDGNAPFNLAVPLSVLKFSVVPPDATNASQALKSILITADGYAQFYIGSVQIAADSAPLTAYAGVDQTVTTGDNVTLQGSSTGGASDLVYAWDLDTHGAFVDQADSQTAHTVYYTGGKDYTVTLRVSDIDGIKAPVMSTMIVHVQDESDNPGPMDNPMDNFGPP